MRRASLRETARALFQAKESDNSNSSSNKKSDRQAGSHKL